MSNDSGSALRALIELFLKRVSRYLTNAHLASINAQLAKPRREEWQGGILTINPSQQQLDELVRLERETNEFAAQIELASADLISALQAAGRDPKGVLTVVHRARGGGGGPAKVAEIWESIKIGLQEISFATAATSSRKPEPAGWFFKTQSPSTLEGLAAWLAQRTAWMHENLVNRFPPEMGEAILRELESNKPITNPQQSVLLYARGIAHSVRFWLDHHGITGQPVCHAQMDSDSELLQLDEHLSKLLAFLRSEIAVLSVPCDASQSGSGSDDSLRDPVTLDEVARLAMVEIKTVRNWGKDRRPAPLRAASGRQAAVYSYAALRDWFLKMQPDRANTLPESHETARATLFKMSHQDNKNLDIP